jgi:anti-anti-sigma factor
MIRFDVDTAARTLRCLFCGHLDTATCQSIMPMLEEQLDAVVRPGTVDTVVFDLAQVNFIPSAFIRLCMTTAKRLSPGRFSIVNTDATIKRTFKIAGLDQLLRVS